MTSTLQVVKKSYKKISKKTKRVLQWYSLALLVLASIDAFAIFLLASTLGTATLFSGNLQADQIGNIFFRISLVIGLFIFKSVFASILYWRTSQLLAAEEVNVGQNHLQILQKLPWVGKRKINASEYLNSIDQAPSAMVQGVLLNFAQLVAEVMSSLLILIVFIVADLKTALVSIAYFGTVAIIQHKLTSKASQKAGLNLQQKQLEVQSLIYEAHGLNKLLEIFESRTLTGELRKYRVELSKARANMQFFGRLPTYLTEATLALGFFVVLSLAFFSNNETGLALSLGLFAATGLRLLPSVNRILSYGLKILGNAGLALSGIEAIEELEDLSYSNRSPVSPATSNPTKQPIVLNDVSFRYQDSGRETLHNISLEFEAGKHYAVVGKSGSGKTTLTDIILGLLEPSTGQVEKASFVKLAFVPQETFIVQGGIERNISLEWQDDFISHELIQKSISSSELSDLDKEVRTSARSMESKLFSGGQKQRIGFARALYREANFLVLDEATSALDAKTESAISKTIKGMPSDVTTVTVAHRLSTIKDADCIIFLKDGKVANTGRFEDLKKTSEDFREMVELSSLD